MIKSKFKIPHDNGLLVEVEGEPITITGQPAFLFIEYGQYNVSHLETGFNIARGDTKEVAIERAEECFGKKGVEAVAKAKEKLKSLGISMPINTMPTERKVLHYLAPIDMPEWNVKKGEKCIRQQYGNDWTIEHKCCFPLSLLEAYFSPVYEKTIHLSEGDYTEAELLEKLKQVKL